MAEALTPPSGGVGPEGPADLPMGPATPAAEPEAETLVADDPAPAVAGADDAPAPEEPFPIGVPAAAAVDAEIEAEAETIVEQRTFDMDGDGDVDEEDFRRIAHRFRLAWIVLAVGAVVLVGGSLAFALTRPAPADPADFAAGWSPGSDGRAERAQEIADHVAPTYRLEDGQQLVDISIVPSELEGDPLGGIAVRDDASADGYRIEPTDDSVVFSFCGDGESCSIGSGEASEDRGRLLKREALEVALLAFNFDHGLGSVVVLMPPKAGSDPSFAMLFERGDVSDLLDAPLAQTIAPAAPTPSTMQSDEAQRIDTLTDGLLFRFGYQRDSQETPYLVLEPPTSTSTSSG